MSQDAAEAPSTAQQMADGLAALEDKPESDQATQEAAAPAPETSEAPDYFGDNFDPSTLPDELQPAYKQLRGDYTRKTQELAEQRKQAESHQALINDLQSDDPEAKTNALQWMAQNGLLTEAEVAQVFGLEIDQPDQEAADYEEDDPLAKLRAEFDEFRNNLSTREQQQAEEAYVAQADQHIASEFSAISQEIGRELSPKEQELIVSRALVAHTTPGEMPDVKAAFKDLDEVWTARQKNWAASKEAPHTAADGLAATEVPDLDNEQARRDYMATQLSDWVDRTSS